MAPNLTDQGKMFASFTWDGIRRELEGLPEGRGLNMAHEAVDRHVRGQAGRTTALRCLSAMGETLELSYEDLKSATNRFANILRGLGIQRGERVFAFLERIPQVHVVALGTLKGGCVFCPLFSVFGPEPAFQRLSRGDASVLVTTQGHYTRKILPLRSRLPELKVVLITDVQEHLSRDVLSLEQLMAEASPDFSIVPTDPEDWALLHFTSGTTGMPKGAMHIHQAVLTHYATAKYVLGLRPGDVFWCTADPGWVTGTVYGILAPLVCGVTNMVDQADFDAQRWLGILQDHEVNVWYTSPTAIRRLMRLDMEFFRRYDLGSLRSIHSVGEPLNAEAVHWSRRAMGLPIHDSWWQTETGGIMIAGLPGVDVVPGAMGLPIPGIRAAIVEPPRRQATAAASPLLFIQEPGIQGELVLEAGWPSMFRGYLHEEERYARCFADGWYLTGDLVKRDEGGYYHFVGRADDLIKTAGHLVGPFEVESALMAHPAVAEAGVIGKPDAVAGEVVKAFVTLKAGTEATEDLRLELLGFARKALGPAVAPREIEFHQNLPKNRAGKIMRRLLKARELHLPEGDVSTLE